MKAHWLLATLAVGFISTIAQAEAPSQEQMLQQIQALRAEVATLKADQDAEWMSERRAEEIKALVHEVLSDAETRASLMDSAITAGHNGKNFFLASEDGSFLMKIAGQIQFRYVANFRDDDGVSAGDKVDEGEAGFVLRRTKLQFSGHIADPKLKYAVQLAVERDDNTVIADKITIGYQLTDDLYIWFGEDKAPFLREEMVSSKKQLAVERSFVNEVFTADKVQGVALVWDATDNLRLQAMIHDGSHSGDGSTSARLSVLDSLVDDSTNGSSSSKDFDDDAVDFAIAARADWVIEGSWAQWKDFTSFPGEERFIYVGGAINYEAGETGASGSAATFTDDILVWTVDAGFEQDGWNAYVAYIGMSVERDSGPAATVGSDFDPWAILVQGGYNIALDNGDSIEPFARWEHLNLDDNVDTSSDFDDEIDLLTVGVNWYHKKHAAKFTADVVVVFDPIDGGSSGLGILPDADGTVDEQVALRAQYQLLF